MIHLILFLGLLLLTTMGVVSKLILVCSGIILFYHWMIFTDSPPLEKD